MASGPIVTLIFDADLDRLRNGVDRVGSTVGKILGSLGKVGGAAAGITGATNSVLTLGAALTTIAPAALALPGILAGIGVAAGTAKLAMSGFTKAVEGDAKALAKFSPAGQAAIKAVQGLGDGFKKMRSAVQQEFFKDLAEPIKTVGTALLDLGTQKLPAVATGFNGMAKEALKAANTDFFKGSVGKIIDSTAAGLGNMKMTLANVVTGFTGLGTVGAQYLPGIGTAIDGVAQRFNDWVQNGLKTGEIQGMVDRAITAFGQLRDFIGLVGEGVGAVLRGIGEGLGANATPLEILKQKAQTFVDIVKSPEAQDAFRLIGEAIRAVSDAFNAVMPHLLGFVFWISGMLMPAVTGFANWVKENPQLFAGIIIGIGLFIGAIKLLLGIITVVRTAMLIWSAVQVAWGIVMGLSLLPILLVVGGILLLIAIGYLLITHWDEIKAAAAVVWEWIKQKFNEGVEAVKGILNWFSELPGKFREWIGAAKDAAVAKFNELVSWVSGIPGRVLSALGNLGSLLLGAGRSLVDGFLNGIKGAWNAVVGFVKQGVQWVRDLFPFSPAKTGPFSGRGYTVYSGRALMEGFGEGIQDGSTGLQSVTGAAMKGVSGQLSAASGGASGRSGGGPTVTFAGNTADALATVIMEMIRTRKIQIA